MSAALATLVARLNWELRDLSPGPERDARLREIAQGHLAAAQSRQERIFWEAFLKAGAKPRP